jgi:hypothetical protein
MKKLLMVMLMMVGCAEGIAPDDTPTRTTMTETGTNSNTYTTSNVATATQTATVTVTAYIDRPYSTQTATATTTNKIVDVTPRTDKDTFKWGCDDPTLNCLPPCFQGQLTSNTMYQAISVAPSTPMKKFGFNCYRCYDPFMHPNGDGYKANYNACIMGDPSVEAFVCVYFTGWLGMCDSEP